MSQKDDNPLSRFERPKINYPLIAAGIGLFAVLIAGVVFSVRSQDPIGGGLFLAGTAIFGLLLLINVASNRRTAAIDDRKFIHWDAAMPEVQRQNVNIEVRELARLLHVDDDQLPDLLSAYIVAEDLALRQVQQEENLPLMRHVSIGKTPFDGILVDRDLITCIEVSFLVVPDIRQEKVESMLKKVAQARKNLAGMKSRLRLRLLVVLVTQVAEDDEDQLRSTVKRRFENTKVDIVEGQFRGIQIHNDEIRFLDFEMLQKVYVSE